MYREFEDASHGSQDRVRALGSSSYGSSVPTRGDSGGYSRGPHRWDSRSSVRGDADLDSGIWLVLIIIMILYIIFFLMLLRL